MVPDEIKAGYMELASNGFLEDQNLLILINNYAIAAVNLYGVISQDELADIFNSQNQRQISVDDVFRALLPYVWTDTDYCFCKQYIVDYEFADEDYESVPLLVSVRNGKPRYTPPKEEFLKYSDWDYYETTPQLLTLKAGLSKHISDPELVLDVLEEIHDMCSAEARIQEFFDLLNSVGVNFDGMGQVEVLVQQIMDVQNNTRLWTNFGHTPSELFSTDKSNLIPFPARPGSVAKIGRNDPCPCGSGKKHKQCCGR